MLENEINKAIIEAKKFNIAFRAVRYNPRTRSNEWGNNLPQLEDEYKIKLSDNDKESLLKKENDLKKDLEKKKLQNHVIAHIPDIFQFQTIKRSGINKKVFVPTKDAAQLLNDSAELLGLQLKAFKISTSQIRRYLDSLRKIKATSTTDTFRPSDVLLQQVKVAYAAGRKSELTFLYEVMKPAITEGSREYHYFEQLLRFVEAIVAYHRFYRGED